MPQNDNRSDNKKGVIISINPKAGRTSPMQRAEALCRFLEEKNFNVHLLTDIREVAELARSLHSEGLLQALVGVGGDGTAATLVNLTEPGTPLTLLSAGTANLLAKHFRLSANPKKLADTIAEGNTITLDAGLTKFYSDGKPQERLFLVMASCGFDADVVYGVHSAREERYKAGHKKGAHISQLSYIKPILKTLFGYRFTKMKIESFNLSKNEWELLNDKAKWAFFFNLNRYGWDGLSLAPFAKGNDGLLDHILMNGGSVFHGILYTAFAQCFGSHRFLPDVKLGQSERYRLSAESAQPVPFQLDGDPGGNLPLEIEIIPDRLTFMVPKRK
jgi:diacylglycerol kinase family enzyme